MPRLLNAHQVPNHPLFAAIKRCDVKAVSDYLKSNPEAVFNERLNPAVDNDTSLTYSAKILADENNKNHNNSEQVEKAKDIFYILLHNDPRLPDIDYDPCYDDKQVDKISTINSVNKEGDSALTILAKNYDENIKQVIEDIIFDMKKVVDEEEDQIDKNVNVNDLLLGAAEAKNTELLTKALEEYKLDIDARDELGASVLMHACKGPAYNIQKIIDHKLNIEPNNLGEFVSIRDNSGKSAVDYLSARSWHDISAVASVKDKLINKLLQYSSEKYSTSEQTSDNNDSQQAELANQGETHASHVAWGELPQASENPGFKITSNSAFGEHTANDGDSLGQIGPIDNGDAGWF
jgi:hypothetical protein